MARLVRKVLRCRHDFSGGPASYNTNERPPAAFKVGGRTICLDCGKELPRDWHEVSVPAEIPSRYEAMMALATTVAES
ncbi:MAG: hypothetical protein ACM3SW_11485 [Actinomycetota bacterium]